MKIIMKMMKYMSGVKCNPYLHLLTFTNFNIYSLVLNANNLFFTENNIKILYIILY